MNTNLKKTLQAITILFLTVLVLCVNQVNAQPAGTSQATNTTKSEDSGSVSLYNGNLNMMVPLLSVGGRGETTVPLNLRLGKRWRVFSYFTVDATNHFAADTSSTESIGCNIILSATREAEVGGCFRGGAPYNIANQNPLLKFLIPMIDNQLDPGYGPGILVGRSNVAQKLQCYDYSVPNAQYYPGINRASITRFYLSFITSDGVQHELIDKATYGKFRIDQSTNCFTHTPGWDFSRGKTFISTDGANMTFVSDTEITGDSGQPDDYGNDSPLPMNGNLYMNDGSRYRIDNSLISSIQDRNGNVTTFVYDTQQRIHTITDSIGRITTIDYDVQDVAPYGLCDRITYYGLGGQQRVLRISKTNLSNALRSGYTIQKPIDMFPLPCNGICNSQDLFDPSGVVSALWLPDGRTYKFQYNSFIEVARVELPSGSAVEYDHDYGRLPKNTTFEQLPLYRRVYQKRTYLDSSSSNSLVNITSYSVLDQSTNTAVAVDQKDAGGNLLSRTKSYFYGVADLTPAQISQPATYSLLPWKYGLEYQTEFIASDGATVLRRTSNVWQQNPLPWLSSADQAAAPPFNPLSVETTNEIYENGQKLVSKVSSINPGNPNQIGFDQYNNPTDVWEYDYGVANPPSVPLRHKHTDYLTVNPANGINYAEPANGSDYALTDPYLRSLPISGKLYSVNSSTSAETLVSQSEIKYDESTYTPLSYNTTITGWTNPGIKPRGNATTTGTWLDTNSSWVETHSQFDELGNARKAWDASGDLSRFVETVYSAANNYAFPTSVTTPSPDGVRAGFTTTAAYDSTTGLPTSTTDANGQTTQISYLDPTTGLPDPLLRVRKVTAPNGQQTLTDYGVPDSTGVLPASQRFVHTKTQIDASNWKEGYAWFDGLGRTIQSQTKDTNGDIFTQTQYDPLSRVKYVSNPYRQNETIYWSRTDYDDLGRVKGAFAPAVDVNNAQSLGTTTYSLSTVANYLGTVVTTTDASGRKGRAITNVLGQLSRVDEPTAMGGTADNDLGIISAPNQPTYYSYSPLGKMVKVQQGGQYRYFLYDSLGRLLRVRQPEQDANTNLALSDTVSGNSQWTAGFTYDNNGNALTAKDAKNTTITNTYDKLNRVLTRSFSDGVTPTVSYSYDGVYYDANNNQLQATGSTKGALTQVRNSISTSQTVAFDSFGRALTYQQVTDGKTYQSSYVYNLSGRLVAQTYPSGRTVTSNFDANGDLSQIESRVVSTAPFKTYASNFIYTSADAIKQLKLGNNLWEEAQFNNRLQIIEMGLGTSSTDTSLWKVNYDYGELQADGTTVDATKSISNIAKQTISFSALANPFVQAYRYDSLNRLSQARETSNAQTWQQTFGYDQYGNRTAFSETIGNQPLVLDNKNFPQVDANTTTNRFTTGQSYGYDANGNLIQDADGRQFTFNGENKQTQVKDASNNVVGQYLYDGDGKRVKKVTNTETTIFVYSGSQLVAEYSTATPPTIPTTSYTATDQLGSPRVITDKTGNVISRRDFMPFGEELYPDQQYRKSTDKYGATDSVRQRFTGYEKDTETGLDFAEARYYNNSHSRFTAVDPMLASGKSANPQSFNRYSYGFNNPITNTDPTGMQVGNYKGDVYYKVVDGRWAFSNKSGNGYDNKYTERTQRVVGTDGYRYTVYNGGWTQGRKVADAQQGTPASSPTSAPTAYVNTALIHSLADETQKKGRTAVLVGGVGIAGGITGGAALVALTPTLTATGTLLIEDGITHPEHIAEAEATFANLPQLADGFARIYRGTGSPNVTQVGAIYRSNPAAAPSGAEVLATSEEAMQHMSATGHPEIVSATKDFGTALLYGGPNGSTIVYDIPTNGALYNNLMRLESINGAQGEMFFKGSIPDDFQIAVIPR